MADVLIVEDEDIQRQLINEFVSHQHAVVGSATTVEEAVDLTRRSDPDAVVMDLDLEDGTGIEATARIKSYDTSISVLVSSVYVSEDMRERLRDAGADAALVKPYDGQDLLDVLDRLCSEFSYPAYDYYE